MDLKLNKLFSIIKNWFTKPVFIDDLLAIEGELPNKFSTTLKSALDYIIATRDQKMFNTILKHANYKQFVSVDRLVDYTIKGSKVTINIKELDEQKEDKQSQI